MSKLSRFLSCSALIAVAACSSSSSTSVDAPPPRPPIDAAPPAIDAAPPAAGVATEVDCTTVTSAPVVATAGLAYSPASTTITAGSAVKFTMPAAHNVASATTGLAVDFSATKCLKFATPGTYTFHCVPHGFIGTIVVTQVD